MRIALYANPMLDAGTGVGVYTSQLASYLARLAPEAEFLWFYNSFRRLDAAHKELGRLASAPNIRVVVNSVVGRALSKGWRLAAAESFLGPLDLYHGTNFFAARTKKARKVITVHDLGPIVHPGLCNGETRSYGPRLRQEARAADCVLTVSQSIRAEILEQFALDPQGVRAVPLAPHPEIRRPGPEEIRRAKSRLGLERPYVLHVGTVQPRKNLVRLVQAFARLDPGLDLVLAGGRGWDTAALIETIRSCKVEPRVRFTGLVDQADLSALYAGAEVFAFPSLYEGFGMPVLEAMTCGTPVVASTTPAVAEIAADAAILVDPSSVEAIAEGLARALCDTDLRAWLRDRGLKVAQQYSWERTAKETMAVYQSVCASAPGGPL